MKKICFITGSRADYGLLTPLMSHIKNDKNFIFQLIVTGTHLSKKHNFTIKEIIKDKFKIDYSININVKGYKHEDICKSMSIATKNISLKLKALKPDLIILLGDRYEIFSACSAAFVHQIPICHLHGGELTRGSIDDGFRHSITKMSNFHLVSNSKYADRVIQLGENPKNIYVVGGFGVDLIKKTKLLKKNELEKNLDFKFGSKNFLVTYHPETTSNKSPKKDFTQILKTLDRFKDIKIIFTQSNPDFKGYIINQMIDKFVKRNKSRCCFINSMGQQNYLSALSYIDGVLGNSSSGLLEVPTFKKATINIGKRQEDRMKATSVIDVKPLYKSISKAIKKTYSKKFKNILKKTVNPYGAGGASEKAYKILKKINRNQNKKGKFFDRT
jgi:GDP/UDP-N,N'-diacetylbacillosamine 2-epimerase (hydrolysing)